MIMKRKRESSEVRSKHGLSFEEREAAVKAREDYCAWLERVIAFRRDPHSCLAARVEASKRLLSDAALPDYRFVPWGNVILDLGFDWQLQHGRGSVV